MRPKRTLDRKDKAILRRMSERPGLPIAHYFWGMKAHPMTLYYRVRTMTADGLIDLQEGEQRGRKLASITPRGREALI